ncbi:hypothetical protein BH11PLA2_BH11PLA2_12110 [soil metagenome]
MKKFILIAVLGVLGFGFSGSTLSAGYEPTCQYRKVVCEEYVTVWVTKSVPYTKEVTKYDHCGKPYTVCVTCYQDVQVPVKKCVSVVKWVKVCD